jgi:hypothetical protein
MEIQARIKGTSMRAQKIDPLSQAIHFIRELVHKFFFRGKTLFQVDRYRYFRLLDEPEFHEFSKVLNETDLAYEGFSSDKAKLRQDRINLFRDFKKTKGGYKKDAAKNRPR